MEEAPNNCEVLKNKIISRLDEIKAKLESGFSQMDEKDLESLLSELDKEEINDNLPGSVGWNMGHHQ
jgi:hypothetical protein